MCILGGIYFLKNRADDELFYDFYREYRYMPLLLQICSFQYSEKVNILKIWLVMDGVFH